MDKETTQSTILTTILHHLPMPTDYIPHFYLLKPQGKKRQRSSKNLSSCSLSSRWTTTTMPLVLNLMLLITLMTCIVSAPLFAQEVSLKKEDQVVLTGEAQDGKDDFTQINPVSIVYPVVMPPYTFENEQGEAQGLAVDLLRLWSKKTGIPIQFKSALWSDGLQLMREGKTDIHASLYFTEERDKYLDYAEVVTSSQGCIFYNKNLSNIHGPEDLKGFRVGVVGNSYHQEYMQKNYPGIALVSYLEFPQMLDAAQKGEIHVFIDDLGATIYRLKKAGLIDAFRYNQGGILYRNNFWLAVREGASELGTALKKGMALITQEERATLEKKWLPLSTVKTDDRLFVAMYRDFSPYTFINSEGEPAGLFVDIWNLWAQKTGKKIEFIFSDWKGSLDNLKKGRADIHSGLFYSDSRAEWLDYSEPFYETNSYIFYSIDQKESYDIDFSGGDKIGAIKGSYHEEHLLTMHPKVEVVTFTNMEKMLRNVSNREISACLTEYLSAMSLINRLGLTGEFNSTESIHLTQKFHWGVPKENPQLFSLVKEGFDAITNNELLKIEERWVSIPDKQYFSRLENNISLTKEEQNWLKTHPNIRLAFPQGHEPSLMKDDQGSVIGIMADYWNLLKSRLGIDVKYELAPISELPKMIKNKDIEGLLFASPKLIEASDLQAAGPEIQSYAAIYGMKTMATFSFPQDLLGKKVAIIKGHDHTDYAVSPIHENASLIEVESPLEGLQALYRREVDFFIGSIGNSYFVSKYLLFGIRTIHVFWDNPYTMVPAIRSDLPELAAILNKGADLITDREFNEIVDKWINTDKKELTLDLTEDEQAWLAQNYTIRVRFWQHPPYFYLKDGKVVGLAVDLLNTISENTGITFQYKNNLDNFSDVLKGLKEHTGPDLVGAMMPTPEREKVILFTEPYIDSPRFIFTRDDTLFIASIENLFGQKVAVVEDYVIHRNLVERYPDIDLLVFRTNEEALRAVSSGEATAFIGDLISTPTMINEFRLNNLKAACPSGLPDHPLALGIRNDWPELRGILNKAIEAIPVAEKAAIINRWSTVRIEHGIRFVDILKWISVVAGVATAIIFVLMLWNKSLKRVVLERTSSLTESEKRFRATFEQAAVGIAHVSPQGHFLRINQKFCDIVGYSHDEMLQLTFQEITHPDDLNADLNQVNRLLNGESNTYAIEKRYIRKNSGLVWIALTVSLVRDEAGKPQWFVSVVKDITIQKQAEEKIRENEEKYRTLVEQAQDGITILQDDKIKFVNPYLAKLQGYTVEELLNTSFTHFIAPDELPRIMDIYKRRMNNEPVPSVYESVLKSKDGTHIEVEFNAGLTEFNGKPANLVIVRDITGRKRAEQDLRSSQERSDKIFQASPAAMSITKLDTGEFIEVNQAFERILGYAREDIIGKSALKINIWKNLADRERLIPLYLKQGFLHEPGLKLVKKSGESRIVDAHFFLLHIGNEDLSIAAFIDITDQKLKEQEIQDYQQRLKELASQLTLAEEKERRRIAAELHDNVGQSLALARVRLAIAQKTSSADKLAIIIDEISESLLHASQDTRNLVFDLSYPTLNEIGLAAAISEWMEQQISVRHELKTEFLDKISKKQKLNMDENMLAILFRNVRELLTNIVKHAQADKVSVSMEHTGENLKIVILDNGVGFDYQKISVGGEGNSGFGLFSIQERMSDLGGSLIIESEPGKGCRAILAMPIVFESYQEDSQI